MAQKEQGDKKGFYVSGAVGSAKAVKGCDTVRTLVSGSTPGSEFGVETTLGACSDSDLGYSVAGGYRVNKHIALEVAGRWVDSGVGATVVATIPALTPSPIFFPAGTPTSDPRTVNMKFQSGGFSSYSVGARFDYPLGNLVAVGINAGVHFWDTKAGKEVIFTDAAGDSVTLVTSTANPSGVVDFTLLEFAEIGRTVNDANGSSYYYGVRGLLFPDKAYHIVGEYTRLDSNKQNYPDFDFLSVSFVYNF